MDLSVVIPAFNEADALPETIKSINDFFHTEHIDGEIIAVNDGSTDRTDEALGELCAAIPCLTAITFGANRGKGAAVRAGFRKSRGVWTIFTDADNSTPIAMWKQFKPFTNQFDILIGSRAIAEAQVIKRQSFWKICAGKLGNKWIQLITGLPFHDTQCGFKAFHKRTKQILDEADIDRWAFDIELLYIAARKGFRIKELPVVWKNDPTSLVTMHDYLRVALDVVRIRIRHGA